MNTAPAPAPAFVLRYRSPNDTNGNARRIYVVYGDDESVMAIHDEGALGWAALPVPFRTLPKVDVDVSASVYRAFLKAAR
jgi:hypothetical protein